MEGTISRTTAWTASFAPGENIRVGWRSFPVTAPPPLSARQTEVQFGQRAEFQTQLSLHGTAI